MTNPQQEAEAIRFGLADVDARSIPLLREISICQGNGRDVAPETLAALISIGEEAQALYVRKAVLDGVNPPARPEWLGPVS
ncbi:MAG TPA: hypothetical protein VGC26_09735 [Afipia sp.]